MEVIQVLKGEMYVCHIGNEKDVKELKALNCDNEWVSGDTLIGFRAQAQTIAYATHLFERHE